MNAISRVFSQSAVTPWVQMIRMVVPGRISSVMTIDCQIPKLDVAGSIPVSRSMFSMTYSYARLMR
jgi:hypothetical protein